MMSKTQRARSAIAGTILVASTALAAEINPVSFAGSEARAMAGEHLDPDRAAIKRIRFTMPEDGYVSLNIYNEQGQVARQLLAAEPMEQGEHTVAWDGLTTPVWKTPGSAVPAGDYTWRAIWHKGIGLRFRGWACHEGDGPWDISPTTYWGGDQAMAVAVASDGKRVYLGWAGSEAGKAFVAVDLDGDVQWGSGHHFNNCVMIACDAITGDVYYSTGNVLRRVDTTNGRHLPWPGREVSDLRIADLWRNGEKLPDQLRLWPHDGFAAHGGKLYLAFSDSNLIAVVDAKTLELVRTIPVKIPGRLVVVSDDLFYVLSERTKILALNPHTGEIRLLVEGLENPGALAADGDGNIYVSVVVDNQWSNNQILVYGPAGELLRKIGEPGGHAIGPWNPYRLTSTWGLAVDRLGKLWVAETGLPKRFVTFDASTGKLLKEYFGPTHYGASGGAVNPRDPGLLVGEGCEWRLDPVTGRATLLGMITDDVYHGYARFCEGANGRQYLAVTFNGKVWGAGAPPQIRIYERLGEGDYAFRASIVSDQGKTFFWADADGDQKQQPEEIQSLPVQLTVGGYLLWSMNLNTDLTFYGTTRDKTLQVRVKAFTECGAPAFDLDNIAELPAMQGPLSSPDNRLVLSVDHEHATDPRFRCYDVATGSQRWTYPNPWSGVHGSHHAPGPARGLIRGAFGIVGNATLPDPVGAIWAINSNVGEWHVLTEDGFYLTRLFQPDSQKRKYPERAVPGAVVDEIPPGLGGEDFGGSLIQAPDGRIYIQAGKTALWSIEAVGFDTVRSLAGGSLGIAPADAIAAEVGAGARRQAQAEPKSTVLRKRTIETFTGDLGRDFGQAERLNYYRQRNAAVASVAAWDDHYLYIGWEARDATPWINGADAPEYMYTSGDTVDFQIALDPDADPARGEAAAGDVRLSIGNFKGDPTAVFFRYVAPDRRGDNTRTFRSGVVEGYVVDSVEVIEEARIEVRKRNDGYTVEAAIPLAALGLKLEAGFTTKGDFGVTHGDTAGNQTAMRTYWSNLATGIVDDDVFELKIQPRHWGELRFE